MNVKDKIIYNLILQEYNHLIDQDDLIETTQRWLSTITVIKHKLEKKLQIAEDNVYPLIIRVEDLEELDRDLNDE